MNFILVVAHIIYLLSIPQPCSSTKIHYFNDPYIIPIDIVYKWKSNSYSNAQKHIVKYGKIWHIVESVFLESNVHILNIEDVSKNKKNLIYKPNGESSYSLSMLVAVKIDSSRWDSSMDNKLKQFVKNSLGKNIAEKIDISVNLMSVENTYVSMTATEPDNTYAYVAIIAGCLIVLLIIAVNWKRCYYLINYCYRKRNGTTKYLPPKQEWIGDITDDENAVLNIIINPFINGTYEGIFDDSVNSKAFDGLKLYFNDIQNTINGNGSDYVGDYNVSGIYSMKTLRISMSKMYVKGTGNPKRNMGHKVEIRLKWNSEANIFEGNWEATTSKYQIFGTCTMKLTEAFKSTVMYTIPTLGNLTSIPENSQ